MSAVNSVTQPVRRNAPSMTRPAALPQHSARAGSQPSKVGFAPVQSEDEFKLNLADLPRAQDTLDVEGFKPSLLSRLFDMLSPLRPR